MKINIKKLHPDAVIPKYAKDGDVGMDLTAISRESVSIQEKTDYIEYKTGIAIEIPDGYFGMIVPRSSNSKKDLTLCNSVGIIDSKYRGELSLRYKIDGTYNNFIAFVGDKAILNDLEGDYTRNVYEIGDRIGQLIILPYPIIEFEEIDSLSETSRGTSGFGSSGK
jgi:dUTP pyrophosphatase